MDGFECRLELQRVGCLVGSHFDQVVGKQDELILWKHTDSWIKARCSSRLESSKRPAHTGWSIFSSSPGIFWIRGGVLCVRPHSVDSIRQRSFGLLEWLTELSPGSWASFELLYGIPAPSKQWICQCMLSTKSHLNIGACLWYSYANKIFKWLFNTSLPIEYNLQFVLENRSTLKRNVSAIEYSNQLRISRTVLLISNKPWRYSTHKDA